MKKIVYAALLLAVAASCGCWLGIPGLTVTYLFPWMLAF